MGIAKARLDPAIIKEDVDDQLHSDQYSDQLHFEQLHFDQHSRHSRDASLVDASLTKPRRTAGPIILTGRGRTL